MLYLVAIYAIVWVTCGIVAIKQKDSDALFIALLISVLLSLPMIGILSTIYK